MKGYTAHTSTKAGWRRTTRRIWHLLKHGEDFESVVRDNIRCGGDHCGRALAAGAIAGYAFGVPDTLIARLQGGRLTLNR